MNIFTKSINEIIFEDVVSFCEQGISENVNLDYKQQLPKELEKTISAFANTYGGIILIGVKEHDSKPKLPVEGIDFQEHYEDRIMNIIVDNIYPPIIPEIQVCPQRNNKTFIIIRIPQSNDTPHAIRGNTEAYIRTGNRNKRENLATMEQLEWLMNKRKRSEDFRESLYRRAEDRYQRISETNKAKKEFCEFTLSFCPLYPWKPLITTNQIDLLSTKIGFNHPKHCYQILSRFQPIQGGMNSFFSNHEQLRSRYEYFIVHYIEINIFGLFFDLQSIGCIDKQNQIKRFNLGELLEPLMPAIKTAYNFYELIGYRGLLEMKLSLDELLGIRFYSLREELGSPVNIENNTEEKLSWQYIFHEAALSDNDFMHKTIIELAKDISWSLGIKIFDEDAEKYLNHYKIF